MNGTKRLQIVDLCGQLLMLLPLFCFHGGSSWNNVFLTYAGVGTWQIISLLANWFGNPGTRPRRIRYARTVTWLGCIVLLPMLLTAVGACFARHSGIAADIEVLGAGLLLVVLYGLLLITPLLAIWYFAICLRELRNNHAAAMHRREIHWKL